MLKIFVVIIASIGCLAESAFAWLEGTQSPTDADWIISGNNIYAGVSGNVGIGDTNTVGKLSVVTNTGCAGSFYQLNAANTHTALRVVGNGIASAIDASNAGTGCAGCYTVSFQSPADVIQASTSGSGSAVFGQTTGTRRAATFQIENAANSYPAMYATTNGTGYGGSFANTNNGKGVYVYNILHLEPRSSGLFAPTEGDIFVFSADHHIYCYLGGTWKQLDN